MMVTDYSPAPTLPSYGYKGHKLRGKKQEKEKRDKEERRKINKNTKIYTYKKICGLG
jgi:hypothetical protein